MSWYEKCYSIFVYFISPLAVSQIHRMVEGAEALEQVD